MTDDTSRRPDLSTRYLGMDLTSPLVASASPLTGTVEGLERLADAGAAALVMPSLFEEQLIHDEVAIPAGTDTGAGVSGGQADGPGLVDYNTGPERYLGVLEEARERVSVPVIASLNGTTLGGWARYAHQCEQAGAHALELNVYLLAADPAEPAAVVEDRYVELVDAVVSSVEIPVAVKLAPYFSSFGHLARRLADAGAQALVLFNRFTRLDVDLDSLEIRLPVDLSTSTALGLPLRWTGMLFGELDAALAVSGGVHSGLDAAKALLVGADVTMMASAVLQRGGDAFAEVEEELTSWLVEHDYESVAQMRGSLSRSRVPDTTVYERANYLHALSHHAGGYRPAST